MTPTSPAPLVRLESVRFAWPGGSTLFGEIDLSLYAGERLGLIGAIGSGKTTLLHLLVGLEKAQAGRIEAFGRTRVTEADFADARTHIGLLFQDADDQLFCPTVGEDVAFGPMNLGCKPEGLDAVVADALQRVGLPGYEPRIAHHLSGGEKRLVSLAGVLAMNPRILLLDEPTSGLDPRGKRTLKSLLTSLPIAQILATHDLELVVEVCSRVIVLDAGSIVAEGSPADILNREELMLAHGLERPHILRHRHPH